jgi:hypothetical protein
MRMRMKIAVYVAVAVVLGLAVMLAPLMLFSAYSYQAVTTQIENGGIVGGKGANSTSSSTSSIYSVTNSTPEAGYVSSNVTLSISNVISNANQTYSTTEESNGNKPVQLPTLGEAARAYGMLDARTEPFPSSLLPVALLVATGLIAALGVSLYYRKLNA